MLNVIDFGAIPDGAHDNHDAFQAAIDAVDAQGGGTISLPPSTKPYMLMSPLDPRDGLASWAGDTPETSRIEALSSDVFAASGTVQRLQMRDLAVKATNGHVLDAPALIELNLERVKIEQLNAGKSIVRCQTGFTFCAVRGSRFWMTPSHAVPGFDLAGEGVNANVWEDLIFYNAGFYPIRVRATVATAPVYTNRFVGLHFEACKAGIALYSMRKAFLLDCHWHDTAEYPYDVVVLGKSDQCNALSGECVIMHCSRIGGQMAAGKYDYHIYDSARTIIWNSAADYPLDSETKVYAHAGSGHVIEYVFNLALTES